MKKRFAVTLACAGCFMVPSCLSVDQNALLGIGEDLLCEIAAAGLPLSDHVDYCSVVDIDIPINLGQ